MSIMTPIISKEWMMEALISMNSVKKRKSQDRLFMYATALWVSTSLQVSISQKKDVTNITITNPIYNKSITITCNVDLSFYIIRYQSMLNLLTNSPLLSTSSM